jgi:chemotaxis protein methyltransferase CheR
MTPTMQNVIPPALTPVDAFTLGEISCQRLCLLLKQWSGVCVDASKAYLIQGRLRGLMAKEQLSDLTDLLDRAERPANAELRNRIVDMMTTHETLFFRDKHPFDSLVNKIVPELISDRSRFSRPIEIHCAACSSGQEPYSIAMLLRERLSASDLQQIHISASDVSVGTIETARKGEFMDHELRRGLTPEQRRRFFEMVPGPIGSPDARLTNEIRDMVRFSVMNLTATPCGLPQNIDILLCRNVLIYFDDETRRRVLINLARAIRPGGLLMLGSSEVLRETTGLFQSETIGTTVVHRRNEKPS